MEQYYNYLNDLRDSGVTNMFGASPYLQEEFGLSRYENGQMYYSIDPQSLAILFAQAQRRKLISDTLNELHSMQFNMLEEALEKSNMAESKTVLAHIMGMK